MSATRTVIAETEANSAVNGVYVGFTVYAVSDRFEAVVRNRTYDGIRVDSKWDSAPIALDATDKDAAIAEARSHAVAVIRALRGE